MTRALATALAPALALAVALAPAAASARTLRALVFDDADGDGAPSAGEAGVPGVVVAYGIARFAVTDAAGECTLEVPEDAGELAWARVPDGFAPGPVWSRVDRLDTIALALRRAPPALGPVTFVVTADTHINARQPFAADLGAAVAAAVALDPPPAFFTILGDITQGNKDDQFDLVDAGLASLGDVPYVPVPGNHDWYDGGETWFRRYGPDNYSFDVGGVHFVVWNLMMAREDIERFLGEELARVSPALAIVALTHAPPAPDVLDTLRRLGVDYVLTGHTHTNRAVDHGGLVELTTEPFLMGGLDLTPAGYRVVTIDRGRLAASHRTVVDRGFLAAIAPAPGACVPPAGGPLIVAAELDAGPLTVEARVGCATPIALRYAGGWSWRAELPPLPPGVHALAITARTPSGARRTRALDLAVCEPGSPPPPPPTRRGRSSAAAPRTPARPRACSRRRSWRAGPRRSAATHCTAPAIAGGAVFATATDLGGGAAGGGVALDLASGAVRWRVATPRPVRGGPAVVGLARGQADGQADDQADDHQMTVAIAQLDGTVRALDARTGAERWTSELGAGLAPEAASVFAPPAADGGDVLVGNQRHLAALDGATGAAAWSVDPVPGGAYSQSLAAVAIGDGVVVGVFHRELGGVIAWDRATGAERWRLDDRLAVAINASPVIDAERGQVIIVNGRTEVAALDLATGAPRWQVRLDPQGFDWGNATVGAPALAHGVVVVPTLYRDLVALDAASGLELWRFAARPGPLRTTHYRGAGEAGFEASPVITGDVVWAADTSGRLAALELRTGAPLWQTDLGAPVLAGLAVAGDWLVVASYDGTVRALSTRAGGEPAPPRAPAGAPAGACAVAEPAGCGCAARGAAGGHAVWLLALAALRARRAITARAARATRRAWCRSSGGTRDRSS